MPWTVSYGHTMHQAQHMTFQGTHPNQIQTIATARRVGLVFQVFLDPWLLGSTCFHQVEEVCASKKPSMGNMYHLPVLLSMKTPFQRTFPQDSNITLLRTVPLMTHLHPLDPTFYICFTTGHMTTLWTKLPTYDLSGDTLKPNVPFPALWIPVTSCDHFRCSQFLSMSLVLCWGDPTQWLNC